MPALNTLSETLNNLYTTTWQNMKDDAIDNIFDASPFWFWLKENDGLESVEGGRNINEPLRYSKMEQVSFIGKGGTVSLTDQEFLTIANYPWRHMVGSLVRFGQDDLQNRGKNSIFNLMNSKLQNMQDSLVDKLEEVLAGTQSGINYNGLQDLVADAPTSGTVGGIDPAVYTWWVNKEQTMTGSSFAVNGVGKMRTLLNDCSNNLSKSKPNIILGGQTPFERYEDSVLDQKRIVNKKLGDAGFENIEFKGIPFIWSPQVASTRIYFLNTAFLKFVYDPASFFEMTDWKAIPDQVNDFAAQIVVTGNFITSRRRAHGVLHTIDTA